MEELQVSSNKTGLKVFINGIPDLNEIQEDDFRVWSVVLERVLTEHFDNYLKRKARDRPRK